MQGFTEARFFLQSGGSCGRLEAMNLETILTLLPSHKGSFVTVETCRAAKTKKSFNNELLKLTKLQLRVGHNYYNQASTKLAHESGERAKVEASKLWHKQSELHSALRFHKDDPTKVYLVGQPAGNRPVSTWLFDGVQVDKSEVEAFLLASEKKEASTSDHIMIAIENITSIH